MNQKTVPVGLLTPQTLLLLGYHLNDKNEPINTDASVLLDFLLEHDLVPLLFPLEPKHMYPDQASRARAWEYYLATDDDGGFMHRMLAWPAACLLVCLESHLPELPSGARSVQNR